jgi:hypothetical protein
VSAEAQILCDMGQVTMFFVYSWPKTSGRPYERKEPETYATLREAEQAAFALVHRGKASSASVVQMKPVTLSTVRYDENNQSIKMTQDRTVRPDDGRR